MGLIVFLIFKIYYFIVDVNKFFIQFYYKKKRENEWIYILHDIKSLLINVLKRFYLSLKDLKEFFSNDLKYGKWVWSSIKY